jgi:site-specific DNA recombinase
MTIPALALSSELKHALLYLRVSTPRQMDTAIDIDPDGNSIATQREFGQRRADSLNAVVDKIFIEPGNSAQSIEKRPVFREVLTYLREHPEIDYVIIYMRSRAFRNFTDAAITKRQLAKMGVKLVSAKEDFGEGYVADAMEAIIDVFNEMEVRRNGENIKAKLRHKALNGGTISRAKLGYLNIRAEQAGRLFNSIGLDSKRAPLVRQAFELYATGEYSIDRLEAAMADLGLTNRPSGRWPQEKPVTDTTLHRMLSDPYYAGWVEVDGRLIQGRHPAIVSQELFDRVQDVMAARSKEGSRDRVLQHYLKAMLYCQRCHAQGRTSRLIYTEAKGRTGQRYGYFLCRARQDGDCNLPHLPSWQVEDVIAAHYTSLQVPADFATAVRDQLTAALDDAQQLTRDTHDRLTKQLAKLDAREQRLIDLAADGILSRAKILERSNAIQLERSRIQASLTDTSAQLQLGADRLRACLDLVSNPAALYRDSPDDTRRQLNSTFYRRFYLDDEPLAVADDELTPPFAEIQDANAAYQRYKQLTIGQRSNKTAAPQDSQNVTPITNKRPNRTAGTPDENRTPVLADIFPVRGSSKRVMVGPVGLEPTTYGLKVRCSTN